MNKILIKDFYNNKCLSEIKDSSLFVYEKDNMNDILTNYNVLPFIGIALKVNNEVIGYTIGEIVNETLMVHVEKADKDHDGAYPTIQKLFSCYCLNKYPKSMFKKVRFNVLLPRKNILIFCIRH